MSIFAIGSIPACAGEPRRRWRGGFGYRVYPRVCGGTVCAGGCPSVHQGLSPRVRGNPRWTRARCGWRGSIPACAGEPSMGKRGRHDAGVYPRVCGGTEREIHEGTPESGLSPRVRGNREDGRWKSGSGGSIPACAGEPRRCGRASHPKRVYPRVCGGTGSVRHWWPLVCGLSPRVRGNRSLIPEWGQTAGSIPACAGEPLRAAGYGHQRWVYPRVCGGTKRWAAVRDAAGGLSPRVRGNQNSFSSRTPMSGSIPACAGEPFTSSLQLPVERVYPRVCGGTQAIRWVFWRKSGLSPRVRGNRQSARCNRKRQGSIPACAGEPLSGSHPRRYFLVYPRVCGGTLSETPGCVLAVGLSPRVRGNLIARHVSAGIGGSIPACAGEPLR